MKSRKKEIFEGGWGILEFQHVVQWEWIDILTLKKSYLKTSMKSYDNKLWNCSNTFLYKSVYKQIIFLRAHFCVINQNLENIVKFLWKSPKKVAYSLTNNISHDHIFYSMCNVNMMIIVTICIIAHDVLLSPMMCLYSMVVAILESWLSYSK